MSIIDNPYAAIKPTIAVSFGIGIAILLADELGGRNSAILTACVLSIFLFLFLIKSGAKPIIAALYGFASLFISSAFALLIGYVLVRYILQI